MAGERRTGSEVRQIITRFLDDDSGDPWAWDDFISAPIADKFLDSVRLICLHCPEQFPPSADSRFYCDDAGLDLMRSIAAHLPE